MKVEFIPDGSSDCPLIRIYDFVPIEVAPLRAVCRELYEGTLDEFPFASLPNCEFVDGCRVTLKAGTWDRGMVLIAPPASFDWILTRGTWDNIEGLLEPFEAEAPSGFQWLDPSTGVSVLISRYGSGDALYCKRPRRKRRITVKVRRAQHPTAAKGGAVNQIMTIAEIMSAFDSEWILVEDPQTNEALEVQSGKVICHSKDRDEVYRKAVELRPKRFATLYTGKMPENTALML